MEPKPHQNFDMRPIKHNGFYCPWNGYQVLAWLLLLISIFLCYLLLTPSFERVLMITFNSILGTLHVVLVLLTLAATVICPTDNVVFATKMAIERKLPFEVHSNESFWMYWQAYSLKSSKHWGQWNRWVYNFDHHWKWLNNWIGEANYVYFIWLLIVVFIECLSTFIVSVILIISYNVNDKGIVSDKNIALFYNIETNSGLFLASYLASWVLLILSIGKACFAVVLLSFQIFVRSKGLNTYKYVLLKNNKLNK